MICYFVLDFYICLYLKYVDLLHNGFLYVLTPPVAVNVHISAKVTKYIKYSSRWNVLNQKKKHVFRIKQLYLDETRSFRYVYTKHCILCFKCFIILVHLRKLAISTSSKTIPLFILPLFCWYKSLINVIQLILISGMCLFFSFSALIYFTFVFYFDTFLIMIITT